MKLTTNDITSRYGAVDALNANFDAVQTAVENTLSRDGTTPNEMEANFDMNGYDILNANTINGVDINLSGALYVNGSPIESGTAVAPATISLYSFTATASQTTYSVAPDEPSASTIIMSVNGLVIPSSALSVATSTITFPALQVGDEVELRVLDRSVVAGFSDAQVTAITNLVMNGIPVSGWVFQGTLKATGDFVNESASTKVGSNFATGTLTLRAGNQDAMAVSAAGNHVVPAPDSGVALLVHSVSGTHGFQVSDSADTAYNGGYLELPVNTQNAAYGCVLADAGKSIYHSDGTARTYTIPANASVAYPIGTTLTFINDASAAVAVTIAITTDTLVLFPGGSTGSRTLAQYGRATAHKVSATRWIISGSALT